jgi:1,4-dihydroxy-2-naphthoate octaprenyltransferase
MSVPRRARAIALAALAALTVSVAPVSAGTAVAKEKTKDRTHDSGRKVH